MSPSAISVGIKAVRTIYSDNELLISLHNRYVNINITE